MSEPISSKKPEPQYFTPMTGPNPPSKAKEEKAPAMKLDAQPDGAPKLAMPLAASPIAASQCVDVSKWPTELLEKNARAMRQQLANDPKLLSSTDKQHLLNIESELSKRYSQEKATSASSPPPTGKVEICERPADLPMNGTLQVGHWWLKTPNKEAGMGPKGGGIPGHKDGPSGYPGVPTTLNDHTGEVPTSCRPLDLVDPDCVDRELVIGKSTGHWLPPFNDCHTVVTDIVRKCTLGPEDAFAYEHNKESDAGVP